MTAAGLLLVGGAVCYAAFLLALRRKLPATWAPPRALPPSPPQVSILVAARNEAAALPACLEALLAVDYPSALLEVIVVDDHSEDATAAIAAAHARADARLRLVALRARADGQGKPAALAAGLRAARGTVVLTTDADCRVPRGWVAAMVAALDGADLAAGPVALAPTRSPGDALQALEFCGLIAVGAGLVAWGRPLLSNGANLAWRRPQALDFARCQGRFDGEAYMRALAHAGGRVVFCDRPEALVLTPPAPGLGAFVRQRWRWARRGAAFRGGGARLVTGGLYGFFAALAAATVAALALPWLWPYVGAAWALKVGAEGALLARARRWMAGAPPWHTLPLAQLLHLPYVLLCGALGALVPVRWKGRRLA